tara:strand:- start:11206 stop:11694 length:489 start_codon:yes stop_codon:yes gene_type:complete
MKEIRIAVPNECVDYIGDIHRFVSIMIEKLAKNAHKGHWDDVDVVNAFEMLQEEVSELESAIFDEDAHNTQREAADVANFALIISSVLDRRVFDIKWIAPDQLDLFDEDTTPTLKKIDSIRSSMQFSTDKNLQFAERTMSDEQILKLSEIFEDVRKRESNNG